MDNITDELDIWQGKAKTLPSDKRTPKTLSINKNEKGKCQQSAI